MNIPEDKIDREHVSDSKFVVINQFLMYFSGVVFFFNLLLPDAATSCSVEMKLKESKLQLDGCGVKGGFAKSNDAVDSNESCDTYESIEKKTHIFLFSCYVNDNITHRNSSEVIWRSAIIHHRCG